MHRVKMSAKQEYEYLANFKVLQNIFKAKKIDKVPFAFSSFQCNLFSDALPRDASQ